MIPRIGGKMEEYEAELEAKPVASIPFPSSVKLVPIEEARATVATLTIDAVKANPGAAGTEEMLAALASVYYHSPADPAWLGAIAVLRKAGQVRAIEKAVNKRLGVGARAVYENRMRIVTAEENALKPAIDIGISLDLPRLTAMAWNALKLRNSGPHLFIRSGIPVRLEKDEQGRAMLAELTPDRMRYEIGLAADWFDNGIECLPLMEVVKNMLATPEMPLPHLRRITGVPIFASDGRLIDRPGFDQASGIYYLPANGFIAHSLPSRIEPVHVEAAKGFICKDMLKDFPFASDADRDNAVALCILGAIREMIPGSTPNHAVEASIRSAGKGKLARAAAGIFAGDELASVPPLESEKEWKDMITSELLSGSAAVLIDNIEKPLRSAALAVAWTEPFWKDRLFHKQVMARVPINCVWITTANNMLMHEDLMTRSIRIRLEPATSRPENRTGLKDLDLWCRENRAALVWAIHVFVRWWMQEGKPVAVEMQSTRHAEWCRVMGGILHSIGLTQFLKNQEDFQRQAASGAEIYSAFCERWWYWANSRLVNAQQAIDAGHLSEVPESTVVEAKTRREAAHTSELLDLAKTVDDFPLGNRETGQAQSLGFWLKGCRGRRIESREEENGRILLRTYVIERCPRYIKGKQPWSISLVEESDLGPVKE